MCASGGGLKFYVVWRVFRVRAISNRQNVSMTLKISREECEGVGQERSGATEELKKLKNGSPPEGSGLEIDMQIKQIK